MYIQSSIHTQQHNNTESLHTTIKLWLCGLCFPLLVACGMPSKQRSALDSQAAYYDNYQDPSNKAEPRKPTSSGYARTTVDIPLPKKGCDGFYSRAAKPPRKDAILAVKEEAQGQEVKVTPLQWDTRGSLSMGQAKNFKYHLSSDSLDSVQLTLDGNDLYATYRQKDGSYSLERHPLFVEDSSVTQYTIKDLHPRTLKAYNGFAYFSDKTNVQAVDLYQSHTPSCRLHTPFVDLPERGFQVNGLVRVGKTLIAMNDSPLSKYVFFFKLDDKGLTQPKYSAQLFYRDQLQYREITAQKNIMVVYGTYIQYGRTGHLLATFDIRSRVLVPMGQHEVRPPTPDVKADPIPAWNGLAVINKHIIISSPRGGIQIFDQYLNMKTRKELKHEGFTTDLMVRNNTAYALTQTDAGTVVRVLKWNNAKQTLTIASTHKLPGTPNRFVR